LRLTCRTIPAKPVEYSIPKRTFSAPATLIHPDLQQSDPPCAKT